MRPALAAGNEYRLLEQVATTALGSVHRAQQVSSGREVAVTVLERLAGDAAGTRAFEERLPAIAALRHRGVLPVEGWGETDGAPSVVNPLPDAEPLSELLATGRLPDRATALRLLREIADAVDYAQRLGVVHGDLEPATVLVSAEGSALVAHFGLASLARATLPSGDTALHQGSPRHVAPERATVASPGPAADVYSFAVIAWQLLTGRLPPGGELAAPAAAVLRRGMDGDPGARWATCGALVEALESSLAGVVAAAAPDSLPEPRAGRLAGLSARTWLAAGAGLLLLGVLAVVIEAGERPSGHGATANHVRPGEPPALQAGPESPAATPPDTPDPSPTTTAAPATPAPAPASTLRPAATAAPPVAALSITVSPTSVRPRQRNVQVTGHGFDPSQWYQVSLAQGSNVQTLYGPVPPGAGGDFSVPVRIPPGVQPGGAVLAACVYLVNQGPTSRCATAAVTVLG